MKHPFRYFNSSQKVTRLAVLMYIRYSLSLCQAEDLLFDRDIDICHETVPFLVEPLWHWHLDEIFAWINGKTHYLKQTVGKKGEVFKVLPLEGGIARPR